MSACFNQALSYGQEAMKAAYATFPEARTSLVFAGVGFLAGHLVRANALQFGVVTLAALLVSKVVGKLLQNFVFGDGSLDTKQQARRDMMLALSNTGIFGLAAFVVMPHLTVASYLGYAGIVATAYTVDLLVAKSKVAFA